MSDALVLEHSDGEIFDLGHVTMRMLARARQTEGTFAIAEFSGTSEGPWTIPHIHEATHETFYILEGTFTFRLGNEDIETTAGAYIRIPLHLPHFMAAHPGGGRFLTTWSPGGLEEMFVKVSELSPESLRDPSVRAEMARTFDSIPV